MRSILNLIMALILFSTNALGAINANTVWEFRATNGNANNGGGFADLNPGTSVDYSNQNAAQLTLTDGATSGIGVTTLTSATGGFTAAMEGNVIRISAGTNAVIGYYQITGYTDGNTVTLDRAPDDGIGGLSGANLKVGGAIAVLIDAFFDSLTANGPVAGNTIYIKNDGAMVLVSAIDAALDGTPLAVITIEGYNTSRGDNPVGNNRPVITANSYSFSFDNYMVIKNLIVNITAAEGLKVDIAGRIVNCKATNTSGTASRYGIRHGAAGGSAIYCEGISTNGYGFSTTTSNKMLFSYAHDSSIGMRWGGADQIIVFGCVIDSNVTGIQVGTDGLYHLIANNTIYNNTTGISGITGNIGTIIVNNILDANTTGVDWGEIDETVFVDYNVWDNTTDIVNLSKGAHAVNGDPGLIAPADGNFTVGSGSNSLDAGIQLGTDVGVVGDYKWNIGADQDDNTAAGGGSPIGWVAIE